MTINGFYIDYITIAYIVIALICIIAGISSGFFKVLLGLLKGVISLVAAFILTKPITTLIVDKTSVTNGFFEKIQTWILSKGDSFSAVVNAENFEESLSKGLTEMNVPTFLHTFITKISSKYFNLDTDIQLGECIAKAIVYLSAMAIIFIILLIIFRIIIGILKRIFAKINDIPILGGINRLLGAAVGLVFGILIIAVVSWGLTFIVAIPGNVSEFLTTQMKLGEDTFTLSKWFFEHNILKWAFELIMTRA